MPGIETRQLYQLTYRSREGKCICAGFVINQWGAVVGAAPILGWMWGKNIRFVWRWSKRKKAMLTKVGALEVIG